MTASGASRGELRWPVKASFVEYVRAGGGTVTLDGGASEVDGAFVFPRIADEAIVSDGALAGVARFGGSARFEAHGGMLDIVIGQPQVRVGSRSVGLVALDVDGDPIALATLDLGTPVRREHAFEWSRVPATLTADGADAFFGVYRAYSPLDPVSLRLAP